jgi:hypothetical protein
MKSVQSINKAGGAGFQVTAYTQTWSDVEARIGSRAKAGQIVGALLAPLKLVFALTLTFVQNHPCGLDC